MEEGTFGEWLKRDGETIERGTALFVLEGEKSAQDIESLDRGILRIPPDGPRPGETVKVGQLLGYLVEAGERAPFETSTAPAGHLPVAVGDAGSAATPPAGPATRRMARELKVDLQRVPGSGPGGRVTPDDVNAWVPAVLVKRASERVTISPRARRLAGQLGVDWTSLRGSGRTGRIRERDVRSAAAANGPAAAQLSSSGHSPLQRVAGDLPGPWLSVTTMRKTIAARMAAGVHETAPVTITTRCDASNLVNLRQQFRQTACNDEPVPGYNDLIIKLLAGALVRHPQLTHQWHERGIYVPEGLHIAVAVDTDAGLLAPVLRDVDRLSLRDVAARMKHLAEQARSGSLSAADIQGGVFTISNLGMFGIEAFTPIINLPQSAILGVGAIVRDAAVVNDTVVPRDRLTLSLTFDHRVVDGAPAARFLQTLRQAIEAPGAALLQ